MKYRNLLFGGLGVIVCTLLLTVAFYSQLPSQIVTHWNAQGQADQWSPKLQGLMLIPIMQVVMLALFLVLPALSPDKAKLDSFSSAYSTVCVIVTAFLGVVQYMMIRAALGPVNVSQFMGVAVFAMFAVIGNLLAKSKRNYWMGIRTPWTLESEEVWGKTHRFAGRLFVVGSVIGFLWTLIFPNILVMTALILTMALTPAVYSYFAYKQTKRLL